LHTGQGLRAERRRTARTKPTQICFSVEAGQVDDLGKMLDETTLYVRVCLLFFNTLLTITIFYFYLTHLTDTAKG
jgi:hypothetical protein